MAVAAEMAVGTGTATITGMQVPNCLNASEVDTPASSCWRWHCYWGIMLLLLFREQCTCTCEHDMKTEREKKKPGAGD